MNRIDTTILLMAAWLSIFAQTYCNLPRIILGGQIDLLPVLALYGGLKRDLLSILLLVVVGGLSFDALSANPLGVSILPLAAVGFLAHRYRDLIMREDLWVQVMLGFMACVLAPALTVLQLLSAGREPILGWQGLWTFAVLGLGGAVTAPLVFWLLDRLHRAFSYPVAPEAPFRADREIKRGRH